MTSRTNSTKRARKYRDSKDAYCDDCGITFRAYSQSLTTALTCHKRYCRYNKPKESRYAVCETGDFIDTFDPFRYEDVPLTSLETTADSLFAVDTSALVLTNPLCQSADGTAAQPDMFMRRATRAVTKQLASSGKYYIFVPFTCSFVYSIMMIALLQTRAALKLTMENLTAIQTRT